MKITLTIAILALAVLAGKNQAEAQGTAFTYQGRVTDNGTNFTGIGQFKFALVNSGTTYWSNDGSSVGGSQPASAVSLGVTNGLFLVTLGNTALANMTSIPADLFTSQPDLQLQMWFSDGVHGFSALSPAQNLTPTPYAVFAESAGSLLGTIPLAQLPTGGLDLVTNYESGVTLANLNVSGSLTLPSPPATIYSGVSTLIYGDGLGNFFAGLNAGNMALTGNLNTGIGDGALEADANGRDNTAVGFYSLNENTSGKINTAVGGGALGANTIGDDNTAIGADALSFNISGNFNTAVGASALNDGTNGSYNTAIGAAALDINQNGSYNMAGGYNALNANQTGNYNTAVGGQALYSNTNGSFNTALGYDALKLDMVGGNQVAVGYEALRNSTNESDLVAVGYQALENDNAVNQGTFSGYGESTAVGYQALKSNSSGIENTAVGFDTLGQNIYGYGDTAIGWAALYAVTGNDNTGVGAGALEYCTLANENLAVGSSALQYCTNDSELVAIGNWTLQYDNAQNPGYTGSGFGENTAVGWNALHYNSSGYDNTAAGYLALAYNTTGSQNTVYGANACSAIYDSPPTTGSQNTAIGSGALGFITTGNNNIALGNNAGDTISTGNNNIDIGNEGTAGDSGVIRIGYQGTQTITTIAGIWGGTLPGSQGVPVYVDASGHLGTVTSSAKFKQDIQPMSDASDVLLKLKPVTFAYTPDIDSKGARQFGLVAEQVSQVDPELVVRDGQNQIYSVRYDAVNAMLLNEFLKQHDTVSKQTEEIEDLKARLEKMEQIVSGESAK